MERRVSLRLNAGRKVIGVLRGFGKLDVSHSATPSNLLKKRTHETDAQIGDARNSQTSRPVHEPGAGGRGRGRVRVGGEEDGDDRREGQFDYATRMFGGLIFDEMRAFKRR